MAVYQLLRSLMCCIFVLYEPVCSENSSIWSDYEGLKIELMNRPAIVHKLPAHLEETTSDPFIVDILFHLREVVAIDQIEQLMTLFGSAKVSWNHKGLTWDSELYGDLREIQLDSKDMWLPTLFILFGEKDSFTFAFPDIMMVNSSGYVSTTTVDYFTFRCRMDVRKYPFDTQTCNFGFFYIDRRARKIEAKLLLQSYIIEHDSMGQADPYTVLNEWKLLEFKVVSEQRQYFTVKIRRQRLYYITVVIFPLVLTSLMIPLVFLIPQNSGEKISYLVTIYTSTAIFLSYISTVLPKHLDSTPFLAILLMEVLCQGFCAILATLLVVSKYNNDIIQIHSMNDKMSTLKEMSTPQKMSQSESRPKEQLQVQNIGKSKKTCRLLKLTGKQLDTFFFYLFQTGQILFIAYLFVFSGWID